MSSSSTNPKAYPNSLLARIDALERAQARLAVAQPGKIKVGSGFNSTSGFAYDGTASTINGISTSATIAVPQFATVFSLLAIVTSVVCCNSSSSSASYSYVWADLPDFSIAQGNGSNVFIQINQQQQRSRSLILPAQAIPAGMTSFAVRGWAGALNTGANADNFVSIAALAIFQY